MKSFMEEGNWRVIPGSAPVGKWRQEDWVEGETELSCSCSRSLWLSCGRSGTNMVLQNYPKLGWGARTLYPYLNFHWPVLRCRLTTWRCDFGQESANERTQPRAVRSQHSQQLGLWKGNLSSIPQWPLQVKPGFWVLSVWKSNGTRSFNYCVSSANWFVRCLKSGGEKKGKDEIGFRSAEFGLGVEICRSIEIW